MARSTKSYEERLLQLEKREQESLEKAKQYAAQKRELKKRQKDVETKKRTHRLCQIGGAVESVLGSTIEEEDIPKLIGFLKRQEANGKFFSKAMQKEPVANTEEVLSAREILRERAEVEKRNKISNIQVGFVTEGTVESLQPYGAFVELGNGVSGLVHISQICEKRIRKPSEVLSVGDKVKVKVIAIKDGKLSLSIKEASDLMAKEVEEESFELPESGEEATTSLGALFANIKL